MHTDDHRELQEMLERLNHEISPEFRAREEEVDGFVASVVDSQVRQARAIRITRVAGVALLLALPVFTALAWGWALLLTLVWAIAWPLLANRFATDLTNARLRFGIEAIYKRHELQAARATARDPKPPLADVLKQSFGDEFPAGTGSAKRDDPLEITATRDYISAEYTVAQFLLELSELEFELEGQQLHFSADRIIDELTYATRDKGATGSWTGTRRYFFDISAGWGK